MKGRSRSRARGRMLASRTLPEGFNPAHISGLQLWLSDNSNFVALAQPSVASPTDLSSGSWTRTGLASVTHGQSDPDGGTSGDLITENTGAGLHYTIQALGAFVTAIPTNVSCAFKYVDCPWVWLQQGVSSAFFNVQTGTVGTLLGATATIVPLGGGWYDCRMIATAPNSATCFVSMANGDNAASYTGTSRSVLAYNVRCTQDRVAQWTDRTANANHVTQATAANQPRWVQAVQNGQPGITFDGVDDRLDATTVANWKFLHDGTGCTVVAVLKPTLAASVGALLATGARSAAITGWLLDYNGASQRLELYVSNGAANIIAATASAASTLRGVPHVISYRYLEGGGTDYDVRSDGVSVLSGSTTGAPSSGNPTVPLKLMSRDNNAFFSPGDVYEVASYNRYISDADVTRVERMLGAKWGVVVA